MVIGICDDEIEYRRMMREYCERYAGENTYIFEYCEFADGSEVLGYEGDIDILLLDVEMKEMDGIRTMRNLSTYNNIKNIIFMSNHDDYVFDSHGNKTKGYIRKSKGYDNFEKYMTSTISEIKLYDSLCKVKIYDKQEYRIIDIKKIVYVHGQRRYSTIHLVDDEALVCENIGYWEKRLNGWDIERIHNSYLVNFDYVKNFNTKGLLFNIDKSNIPVGRKFYDISKRKFDIYTLRKIRERGI